MPTAIPATNAYYIIWWHNIPLGDFYVHNKEEASSNALNEKVVTAIKEALQFYTNEPMEIWDHFILKNNIPAFKKWLSPLIKAYTATGAYKSLPVSVIICTHNRAIHLEKCLHKLKNLNFAPQEIIVVDNAPTNNETQKIVDTIVDIKYIVEPQIGLDNARNTGLKIATKPIVAFIDDDALAHPYWIYRIWETFENSEVVAMTGLVFPSKLNTDAQVLFEKYWSFNRGFKSKHYDESYIKKNTKLGAPVWEIGAGVNMAFKREIFEKIGYFNKSLDAGAAGCNGDSEMWFRILTKGLAISYNPKAVVFHEHREDMKGLEKQVFNYMKGNTVAALIQQQYHPASSYRTYLINTFIRKVKLYILGIIRRRWFTTRILTLELKGIIAGLLYYNRIK